MSKDAGLRVRIDRGLREQFLEVCRAQDRPAAQVIREFMREYIASHQNASDTPARFRRNVKGRRLDEGA
jgi:hypothetical protein